MNLDVDNFSEKILNSKKPALVVFWRPGCPSCNGSSLLLEDLKSELGDKIEVGLLNIFENPEIAEKYKIPAVPTLIIFKEGKPAEKAVGLRSKEILVDKINSLI